MTRRELLSMLAATPLLGTPRDAPATPVSIARCPSYDGDLAAVMGTMFDQLGGLPRIVRNKTVTIKLNLTGSPGQRFQGKALGTTHYTHPKTAGVMATLLDRAGARRIRFVESCFQTNAPLEEYLLDSGWNVRALRSAAKNVEFENTNFLGKSKSYARLKVPTGGAIYPAFDVNPAYTETDVYISMAKLKDHATCGVTLSMKNSFGITPSSIYGDDAGIDEPNENPGHGRVSICHEGKRQPSRSAPGELNPASSRHPGYRMPRIVADLAVARPVDVAFIDGIETLGGGEGPWIQNRLRTLQPGLLILGTNGVNADTVATAAMGYNPRAAKGAAPFADCDNTLLLAEALGVGSADLKRIEVRGVALADAMYRFG